MATYGISSWIAQSEPAEAIAALATRFARVELSDELSPLVRAWELDPEGVTARLNGAGLTVSSVHTPVPGRYLDLADEAARAASIEANRNYFALMARAGIPEMVVHPISDASGLAGPELARARERVRDSLAQLAVAAAGYGLRLAVENLGANPDLAGSLVSLVELTDGLGAHVGLCHDLGHSVQARLDPVTEGRVALQSGRLFSLHLHDVDAELRDHYLPGEGQVDFPAYLRELTAYGFAGTRTLEIAPGRGELSERLARAAQVREAWEALA